jgi:light-regulated signal transduction histidine kinase (bacteriophytochrome)
LRLESANHILISKNTARNTETKTPIGTTASPILDQFGKVLGVVLVFRDMTEHRHIEESLRRANEDLRRSNDDLEQFAYAASHDLQEPLRTVSLYASLLQAEYGAFLNEDANTYIDFAVSGAERMSSLLQSLLAYSRIGGAATPEDNESADGATALEAAKENLSSPILQTHALIEATSLPRVAIPQLYLVQLFQNLISNAIKYRSARPVEIRIAAEPFGNFWQFSVTDNGMGIRAEYLKQVFGIFKRLHGAEFEGTGIGLAICQKIVDRAHGRIWAESRLGEGTTFYFTLPADQAADNLPHEQADTLTVS